MKLNNSKLCMILLLLSSCSTNQMINRSPSSALKYPEFELNRKFFFNSSNCESSDHPFLSKKDYKFNEFKEETGIDYYASNGEIKKRFDDLYRSSKRLRNRLTLRHGAWVLPYNGNEIVVEKKFLNSLANHIEQAFNMNVVEYLFYPDMGHIHLYTPIKKTEKLNSSILSDTNLKGVYHTAEKLMMKNGRMKRDSLNYRQFRYRTRNLIGGFDHKGSLEVYYAHNNKIFNTLHEIPGYPGYQKIGQSLYLSANQNGCIGYQVRDKTYFFDISFSH